MGIPTNFKLYRIQTYAGDTIFEHLSLTYVLCIPRRTDMVESSDVDNLGLCCSFHAHLRSIFDVVTVPVYRTVRYGLGCSLLGYVSCFLEDTFSIDHAVQS